MGTIIKSVAFVKLHYFSGILKLSAKSAKICLKNAGLGIEKIGMIINTSVYSENYLSEPALAALIQNKLEIKSSPCNLFSAGKGKSFSFDLHNGGGGIINALQIIDGFIQSGEIENGLVISGDKKPNKGLAENYNYSDGAGSVLLSKGNGNFGFIRFITETFPEFENDFESAIKWDTGNFRFQINQHPEYLKNCVECAAVSLSRFLKNEKLSWNQIDLVLTCQSPKGFGAKLQEKVGVTNKIVVNGNVEFYSSGILFQFNKVFYNRRFTKAKNILFVTVGAGITVSISLYKNQ